VRVAIDTDLVEVAPGAVATVAVEVANNASVIDGVAARVVGFDDRYVTAQPQLLPLFPDARGQVTLSLAVPPSYPAGLHPLAVEVRSHGARAPSEYVDFNLEVAARPAVTLGARPKLVRARRSARFVLEINNGGNVPLDVNLQAIDVDRSCEYRFSQERVRVDAGSTVAVVLTVRCPRMFTGGEFDRAVTVEAAATRLDLPPDTIETDAIVRSPSTTLQVRQRPLVSRGVLTALILASIVALWAGAFLLGLTKVFSTDPLAKTAPTSFFVGTKGSVQFAANATGGNDGAPVGSLPRDGRVPPGVGAEVTGTVFARSNRLPAGRILVEAVRMQGTKPIVMGSAATQADGTYTMAGLFPTSYFVKFSATGFKDVWFPSAGSLAGARSIATAAQGTVNGVNAIIAGEPASIAGKVDAGDTARSVITTVTAHPLVGNGKEIPPTQTDASGNYVLKDLPAPATYELTFTAKGYRATAITDSVNGGEARSEPAVVLGSNTGKITGIVTDGEHPLGGATVSTTVNGKPVSVITPTTGQVGTFELDNLVTPGTYVISFSAPGHGTETKIKGLRPGQQLAGVDAKLRAGTGSVTGVLQAPDGTGIGGATITVGGATTAAGLSPTTTTLTAGGVGQFAINGLISPGFYTLTATLDGYAPATVPFMLAANKTTASVTITVGPQLGSITGLVSGPECPADCVGATVTATNGAEVWTTSVTVNGGPKNQIGYVITGLQPGTYSVTVRASGMKQQTGWVTVSSGARSRRAFRLEPSA
jgi:hypothetical protein